MSIFVNEHSGSGAFATLDEKCTYLGTKLHKNLIYGQYFLQHGRKTLQLILNIGFLYCYDWAQTSYKVIKCD